MRGWAMMQGLLFWPPQPLVHFFDTIVTKIWHIAIIRGISRQNRTRQAVMSPDRSSMDKTAGNRFIGRLILS
jgi:hypothetical protein